MPHGIVVEPEGGEQALHGLFTTVLADTSTFHGVLLDGSKGRVWTMLFSASWAGFNGQRGVYIKGDDARGIAWTGGAIRENGDNGVWIEKGTDIQFDAVQIASNSRAMKNVANGISIQPGVRGVSVRNSRIGNYTSVSGAQACGIFVERGAADVLIGLNDLRGNSTGAICGEGTARRYGNMP